MTILAVPSAATPGVYDIPSHEYHVSPALSASGMRKILDPGCPALFQYERINPPKPRATFDFGHIAHRLVLGDGEEFVVCHFDNWLTKASKEARDDARAAGFIPMLPADMETAQAMADAVHAHPVAGPMFTDGRPEQSLFWNDQRTGTPMRARFDWLRDPHPGRRLVIPDYKTTTAVDLDSIERTIVRYAYHQQGAQYRDAAIALGLGDKDTAVSFVFQEKTAPFLVRVVQLDQIALQLGQARNRAAVDLFRECEESGEWPGYNEVSYAALPPWAERKDTEEYL